MADVTTRRRIDPAIAWAFGCIVLVLLVAVCVGSARLLRVRNRLDLYG